MLDDAVDVFRLIDEAGDHHGACNRRDFQRGVWKRRLQQHREFSSIAHDQHIDRVELLVLVPEVDLRHARRLRRNLNLSGRQGRQFQDVGIADLGLGNLLLHREDAAGMNDHIQPIVGGSNLVNDRRFDKLGDAAGGAGGSSASAADGSSHETASGASSRQKDRVYILVFLAIMSEPCGSEQGLP